MDAAAACRRPVAARLQRISQPSTFRRARGTQGFETGSGRAAPPARRIRKGVPMNFPQTMNLLQIWIQTPLASALGWTLAHFLWEGTLIALLLAGVLRQCHPGSARLRYALALAALLAMPVAFIAT